MAPSSLLFAVSDDRYGGGPTARAVYCPCRVNLRWVFVESKRCWAPRACVSRSSGADERAAIAAAVPNEGQTLLGLVHAAVPVVSKESLVTAACRMATKNSQLGRSRLLPR